MMSILLNSFCVNGKHRIWVAHVSRVLVLASRQNNLSKSSRKRDAFAGTRDACATQIAASAAGSRRSCRRWGFAFCFRSARRRRALGPGQFRAFFQPRLIICGAIDDDCSFHSVMTESAELSTNHFVSSGLDRFKPHRNERARNCVSCDAHVRKIEIVNHILR